MLNILCGPFVGSFDQEILTFRPHIKWISENLKYDNLIVSTHSNRQFLYDDIPNIKFHTINSELSISENRQFGILNSNLTKKEYVEYCKVVKDEVSTTFNFSKKTIRHYPLLYNQSPAQFSSFQKSFSKINNTTKDIRKKIDSDEILFIPDTSESEEKCVNLFNMLKKNNNVVIVGDSKIHLSEKNIIIKRPDYFTNVYKCIIKWLDECKIVVCPASHWTFLAQLQSCPVYSWGSISQYKNINETTFLLPACEDTPVEKIYDQFMWNINRRKNV